MPLVSIIIPVYNVSLYIKECINSVIEQTITDLEVLIVDDRGDDDSVLVIEQILSSYKGSIKFEIIHHDQNKGLSSSRNTGIEHSNGKYIFFLDSDDYIYPDCISKLLDSITSDNDVQMAIGNYYYESKTKYFPPLLLKSGVYQNNILDLFVKGQFYMMAWNKLYKKQFLVDNGIRFKEGLIHEDILWSFCCSCHLVKISVVDDNLNYYRIHEQSIQGNKDFKWHYDNYCIVCSEILNYIFNQQLQLNRSVYDYVNAFIKKLYVDPLFNEFPELTKSFYLKL